MYYFNKVSTHPDVLMSSVKLAQATKSSRYPVMTDSFPLSLSITALRISARTHENWRDSTDKIARMLKSDGKPRTAIIVVGAAAMFTWRVT